MKALDVMGFAGGFGCGVDQAGFDVIAKREPAKFGGFGVASHALNMPWMEVQVSDPEDWALPEEPVELMYGCPPCSGFSQLSFANTKHGAVVGPDAEINECMVWWSDMMARVKPEVGIMESVGVAFKSGRDWMEGLHQRIVERSGIDYHLTHVVMNNSLVGGDVIRPRYFMVVSKKPFGVGLDFVQPRNMIDVIGDLGPTDPTDRHWNHMTLGQWHGHTREGNKKSFLWEKTLEWLAEQGIEWTPGKRLPEINGVLGGDHGELEPPEYWLRPDGKFTPRNPTKYPVLSHWFSTDPFSTYRWRPDKPFGVVVAATLGRAIHPTEPRPLTFREAARFVSLPDDWSLAAVKPDELGKAVTAAAGKWIAHWARMAIEGTPGEYAGIEDRPGIRVIDVRDQRRVDAILNAPPAGAWWPQTVDESPATWIIDRKSRPALWPQETSDVKEAVSA